MRVNILVGGRFHSVTLADALIRLKADTVIYTSTPASRFHSVAGRHSTSFVPMPLAIAGRVSGINLSAWDPLDTVMFDRMAAAKMRDCDVIHGWAGYSLYSAQRAKGRGSSFFLERSCPHVDNQESLLMEEAQRLEIPHTPKPNFWLDRSRAEYEVADVIVVPSHYSQRSFLERGFDPAKIVRAPLDFPVLYQPQSAPLTPHREFIVGALGGNVLRKGYLDLLEAWRRAALPNARLLIKASESELRRSPRLRAYLDSCSNVEVVGYVEDIATFYRRCDVFCLPSIDDGFGLAMLEALSCGVPVIVTENVGASELLSGEQVGYVIPIRKADAIAERLQTLYDNPDLRAEMARNALLFSAQLRTTKGIYFDTIRDLYSRITPKQSSDAGRRRSA